MLDSVDNSKREELIQTVTHIYEACAFHDLIGQRITKVMKGLTHIDHALHKIFVGYLGENYDTEDTEIIPENAILENGPQLPKRAPTQDVIDAIFNSQSTS